MLDDRQKVSIALDNLDHPHTVRSKRMTQIIVGENEGIESALRRFKKKIQKAGLLADIRRCQYHETAGEKRKRKAENAKRRGRFRRRDS